MLSAKLLKCPTLKLCPSMVRTPRRSLWNCVILNERSVSNAYNVSDVTVNPENIAEGSLMIQGGSSGSTDLTPAKRTRTPIINLEEAFDQNSVTKMACTIKRYSDSAVTVQNLSIEPESKVDMNRTSKKKKNENGDGIPPPKRRKQVNRTNEEPDLNVLQDITNSNGNITKDARMQRRLRLIQKRKFGDRNIQEVNQTGISMIQSQNVHKLPSQGSRNETQNQNISVMENHPIETQSNQTADLMASTVEQSGYPSKKRACREKSSSLIRKQESVKGNTKFSNRHGGHTIRMSPSVQNITQSTLFDIGSLINPTQTLCSEGPHSSGTTNLTDIPGPSSSAISVDSDSSDNDDDLWECSSGDGVETGTDSDTCDDNSSEILKRQAQTKFELVSKAEKALAEMFGRLQNKKTKVADSAPTVSTQEKGDRGTKNMVVDRTRYVYSVTKEEDNSYSMCTYCVH
uniref:Uncharacterized protein n=1 Tax=Brassica campestris TaxID=3711 RepID=M4EX36_BRACM